MLIKNCYIDEIGTALYCQHKQDNYILSNGLADLLLKSDDALNFKLRRSLACIISPGKILYLIAYSENVLRSLCETPFL